MECTGNIEAAHVRMGTDGGMGMKPSDCYVVPLCSACHAYQHKIGERKFWGDSDPASLGVALWFNTGDWEVCANIINQFQTGRFDADVHN
jgi:hypothetical protein